MLIAPPAAEVAVAPAPVAIAVEEELRLPVVMLPLLAASVMAPPKPVDESSPLLDPEN